MEKNRFSSLRSKFDDWAVTTSSPDLHSNTPSPGGTNLSPTSTRRSIRSHVSPGRISSFRVSPNAVSPHSNQFPIDVRINEGTGSSGATVRTSEPTAVSGKSTAGSSETTVWPTEATAGSSEETVELSEATVELSEATMGLSEATVELSEPTVYPIESIMGSSDDTMVSSAATLRLSNANARSSETSQPESTDVDAPQGIARNYSMDSSMDSTVLSEDNRNSMTNSTESVTSTTASLSVATRSLLLSPDTGGGSQVTTDSEATDHTLISPGTSPPGTSDTENFSARIAAVSKLRPKLDNLHKNLLYIRRENSLDEGRRHERFKTHPIKDGRNALSTYASYPSQDSAGSQEEVRQLNLSSMTDGDDSFVDALSEVTSSRGFKEASEVRKKSISDPGEMPGSQSQLVEELTDSGAFGTDEHENKFGEGDEDPFPSVLGSRRNSRKKQNRGNNSGAVVDSHGHAHVSARSRPPRASRGFDAIFGRRGHGTDRHRGLMTRGPVSEAEKGMLSPTPSQDDIVDSGSSRGPSPLREMEQVPEDSAKSIRRRLIVEELFTVEQEYVNTLKMLVEKYLTPLKAQDVIETSLVDDIFYKIPEFHAHHSIFFNFLKRAWDSWSETQTIGDVVYSIFSKESVTQCYVSFIENYRRSERTIELAMAKNSTFARFVELKQRENKSKLDLKALIVQPAQRLPRYLLLLRRLLNHTPESHPDYKLLVDASSAIHSLAERIEKHQQGESLQDTLRKLETLLDQQLLNTARHYLRHDIIQIQGKKEQCCCWLFNDIVIFSAFKRKSGTVPRKSLLIHSPNNQDFAEQVKHKAWLRLGLDDMEIRPIAYSTRKKSTPEQIRVEGDLHVIHQIQSLLRQLSTEHLDLSERVADMTAALQRQVSEYSRQQPTELNKLELIATTDQSEYVVTMIFLTADKRAAWESSFNDAKQKLSASMNKRVPNFLQSVSVSKNRPGMQFQAAACHSESRDLCLLTSDGFIDHVSLLTFSPDPMVSMTSALPNCNGQVYSITSAPAAPRFAVPEKDPRGRAKTLPGLGFRTSSSKPAADIFSDSDSNSDSEIEDRRSLAGGANQHSHLWTSAPVSTSQSDLKMIAPVLERGRSTIWFGAEDGIHVFAADENFKTTKLRCRIPMSAAVLSIVYVENHIVAATSAGDIFIFTRTDVGWDSQRPRVLPLPNSGSAANKLAAVCGKVWCAQLNVIHILDVAESQWERTLQITPEANRGILSIVSSGHTVWVAPQSSHRLLLYHAQTGSHMLEVSLAPAVSHRMQNCDEIIRQHKLACLKVTGLALCRDVLWAGTSAGVIVTLPSPRLSLIPPSDTQIPEVTALAYGHTGPVRFMTCVEMPAMTTSTPRQRHQAADQAKMLVISGGEGTENFQSSPDELSGRDDSTNHVLLWEI